MRLIAASLALFLLSTPSALAQPPRPGAPSARARDNDAKRDAIVRGRVVSAGSGAPIRRAQITIGPPGALARRFARTDARGRYELKIAPGRYSLTATRNGYLSLQYGQTRPREQGKAIELQAGQTLDDIDFTLPRAAVISGRILDDYGEPISNVLVRAMRDQFANGRRALAAVGDFGYTNDLGDYRIHGLSPGDYYVGATFPFYGDMETDDRSGFAETYFPGTPIVAQAQKVGVGLGQEIVNVDFALTAVRTARVTGTAVDATGRPMAGANIVVTQIGDTSHAFTTGGGWVAADGSFAVDNVAPGEYRLSASTGNGHEQESASTRVTVGGEDVAGVRLAAARAGAIAGQIVLEGATPDAPLTLSWFDLRGVPASEDERAPFMMPVSRTHDDLAFELRSRPMRLVLRAAGPPTNGWWLKAVLLDGVDVTDRPLEIRSGREIAGVQVVFTRRATEVRGTVTTGTGDPARDYTVVVFAADRDRWEFPTRFVNTGRPDQDARYRVTGLPPGEYLAIAVDYVQAGDAYDPELLERLRPSATRLTLSEGETKTLDLPLKAAGS